jgi:hypothetical protein
VKRRNANGAGAGGQVAQDLRKEGVPPTRVFCEKRLQTIENKGRAGEKEGKERKRGGKLLQGLDLPQRRREHRGSAAIGVLKSDTPGNADGCENTGVVGQEICKYLKARGVRADRREKQFVRL